MRKEKSENFKRAIKTMEENQDVISERMKNYKENGKDALLDFDKYAEDRKSKGKTSCNRTACQIVIPTHNVWYNETMDANYCQSCAFKINDANPTLNLCVRVKQT